MADMVSGGRGYGCRRRGSCHDGLLEWARGGRGSRAIYPRWVVVFASWRSCRRVDKRSDEDGMFARETKDAVGRGASAVKDEAPNVVVWRGLWCVYGAWFGPTRGMFLTSFQIRSRRKSKKRRPGHVWRHRQKRNLTETARHQPATRAARRRWAHHKQQQQSKGTLGSSANPVLRAGPRQACQIEAIKPGN